MSARLAARLGCVALAVALAAPVVVGYIHFPPMTLPKMCSTSHHIRVLSVKKHDKEKGLIVFEVTESLKGRGSQITSFKHLMRTDGTGVKPVLDWVAGGKQAVMFTIEGRPQTQPVGLGYVFIDQYCYSVDYNSNGEYWLVLRGEPDLSACYYGSVEELRKTVKDILDGKEVKVSVKVPEKKENKDQRNQEINDLLNKNRSK